MDIAGDLETRAFPWRTAALVAAVVAVAELAALLAFAGVRLAPSFASGSSPAPAAAQTMRAAPARTAAPAAATTAATPARSQAHVAAQPLRPRSHVSVLVLNGNGITHAASTEASRLLALGYRAATPADAPTHGYAHSIVLYAPGYAREGKRLGKDAGIAIVGPLDGLTPSQIKGSQLVVILGDS